MKHDIASILSSLPHDHHNLVRYLKLCEAWGNQILDKDTQVEKHHICPQSMFPEFKDGRTHKWNIVRLTPRQHYIAHVLLWKIFRNRQMALAARYMMFTLKHSKRLSSKQLKRLSSKQYERLRIDASTKGITFSKDHKNNISKARIGFKASAETRAKMSIIHSNRSPEIRAKIGARHRGKGISPEMRAKQSLALSGSKNPRALPWIVTWEDGKVETISSLKSWCRERNYRYTTVYHGSSMYGFVAKKASQGETHSPP